MTYRDYLDKRGVGRGPWVTRERDGRPSGQPAGHASHEAVAAPSSPFGDHQAQEKGR